MKKILFCFLTIFCFNVYALEEGTLCSYNIENKNVSVTYYEKDDISNISSFKVNGKEYPHYVNKLSADFIVNNYNTNKCPSVSAVNFNGNDYTVYFITDDLQKFNNLVASGNIVYVDESGDTTEIYGQMSKPPSSSGSLYNHKVKLFGHSDQALASEAFFEEAKALDDSVDKYLSDDCTSYERSVIYNYLLEHSFRSVSSFGMTYDYKGEKVNLSSKCVNAANALKNKLTVVEEMLGYYDNNKGDKGTMSYLYLQGSCQSAYAYLHSASYDLSGINRESCDLIGEDVVEILNIFFDSFRIAIIALVIFMIYLDGMKALGSKDDLATKKWLSSAVKRLAVMIIVLVLPFLIDLVIDLLNLYFSSNYVNIDGECVKVITGM